jgi:demethylmenaquinone methyltransferase/2-methoxy-6-polyprenyl-1,4-benzoquinol methylase
MDAMDDLYERQKRYYQLRAHEYDATAWEPTDAKRRQELLGLLEAVAALPPARTLDIACGTGFVSQHLRGDLALLDASDEMLAIAAARLPHAQVVHADALPLPFADSSFERVFSGQFYDHLRLEERMSFLAEARRVAPELVLLEQTRGGKHVEGFEERFLESGERHEIYTVYFSPESLLAELGGGDLRYASASFLLAVTRWNEPSVTPSRS